MFGIFLRKKASIFTLYAILVCVQIAYAQCSNTHCKDKGYIGDIEYKCYYCGKSFLLENAQFLRHDHTEIMGIDYYYHYVLCPYCGAENKVTVYSRGEREIAKMYEPSIDRLVNKAVDDAFASCFIATAAYENPHASEVEVLRRFRDIYLLSNPITSQLVHLYYFVSPSIANTIEKSKILKIITRIHLTPVVVVVYPFVAIPETLMYFLKHLDEKEKNG